MVVAQKHHLLTILLPILLWFGLFRIRVPIRRRYKFRFYCQIYGRDAIFILLIILVGWRIIPSHSNRNLIETSKRLGILLAAVSPWILFDIFFPGDSASPYAGMESTTSSHRRTTPSGSPCSMQDT